MHDMFYSQDEYCVDIIYIISVYIIYACIEALQKKQGYDMYVMHNFMLMSLQSIAMYLC